MKKYEVLQNKAENALNKAKEAKDVNMVMFYLAASKGFITKALKLTTKEANEEVIWLG